MAAIERTAYPRFRRRRPLTERELAEVYTPTPEQREFMATAAHGDANRLGLALQLKTFQRLGYFCPLEEIPVQIVDHVRAALEVPGDTGASYDNDRTLYRHRKAILRFLGVRPYGKRAGRIAARAMRQAAAVMDDPVDLINVALEVLVKESYELPGYSTLDRLAATIRTAVNKRIYAVVFRRIARTGLLFFQSLLQVDPATGRSPLNRLKTLPKSATVTHLRKHLDHLDWLVSLGDMMRFLDGVPHARICHYAAQARALDASELGDFTRAHRYTLLASLVHRSQIEARDAIVTMLIKAVARCHRKAKDLLEKLKDEQEEKAERLVQVFTDVLGGLGGDPPDDAAGRHAKAVVAEAGGVQSLLADCEIINACAGDNYLPLLWRFYPNYRPALFRLVRSLDLHSTTEDERLMRALDFLLANEDRRVDLYPGDAVDLSFVSEKWQKTLFQAVESGTCIRRRAFETCVFSYLASELKAGDVAVRGSDEFADYRAQLLPWEECERLLADYVEKRKIPGTAKALIEFLQKSLRETAARVDAGYPENDDLVIDEQGEPVLKRRRAVTLPPGTKELLDLVRQRMPERTVLEILFNTNQWTNWTRHFGPLSGGDPKLDKPGQRYVVISFVWGTNMGPNQGARHIVLLNGQGNGDGTPDVEPVSAHELSYVNRRHVTADKLDLSIQDLIRFFRSLGLPVLWGDGKSAALDGTQFDVYEENLLAEFHVRHGGFGGLALHVVANDWIALISHFIPCGTSEALYILEGLLKLAEDLQPDTIECDTHGQNEPAFALAFLLGIKLWARIKDWKELKFYRPDRDGHYEHIDVLFKDVVDWDLIERHWKDLMQVILSIKAGRISSPTVLRRLGNRSPKNRLHKAFRELGRVIRTIYLLEYISDPEKRRQVEMGCNRVESYHEFAAWLFFGGEGIIARNDPVEQEKAIKYNDLVANAVIVHNTVDLANVLLQLKEEGHLVTAEMVAHLSPYMTTHIKRFGVYVVDENTMPPPLERSLSFAL